MNNDEQPTSAYPKEIILDKATTAKLKQELEWFSTYCDIRFEEYKGLNSSNPSNNNR